MATEQKKVSTFGDVFKGAYQIVKRHKFMWIFGFFAAFLGAGGELEPLLRNYSSISETTEQIFSLQSLMRSGLLGSFFENITNFFGTYPFQSFMFLFIFLIVACVMLWLSIVSQVALFSCANKVAMNQPASYKEVFRDSHKYFGPVFLINIIVKFILYVLFIVVTVPLMSWFVLHNNVAAGVVFVIAIFLVLIPISILASFIVKYAVAYIVIEGKKPKESIGLGWELFKKNWLVSVEMALIVLVIGVGVGITILIGIGLSAIPFILISVAALLFNSSFGFAVTVVVATLVFLLIAAFLGSIYVAYQYSAWTLLFKKLVAEKAQSKLIRLINKIIPGQA